MRTTVDLADDVLAVVDKMRHERGIGLSEAVNELVRAGTTGSSATPYVHRSADLGSRIDLSDVGAVLDRL